MGLNLGKNIKFWLAKKTEDCKSVSPLFSYALDRKLAFSERIRIKIHLFTCSACENYVSNLSFMHDVFVIQSEKFESEEIHVSLSSNAKERLKKALESAE
jgi:predicted anti-sigma-YlaC factor YlaD